MQAFCHWSWSRLGSFPLQSFSFRHGPRPLLPLRAAGTAAGATIERFLIRFETCLSDRQARSRGSQGVDEQSADRGSGVPARLSGPRFPPRSEEHTSELTSLLRTSYAVFCLKKKT